MILACEAELRDTRRRAERRRRGRTRSNEDIDFAAHGLGHVELEAVGAHRGAVIALARRAAAGKERRTVKRGGHTAAFAVPDVVRTAAARSVRGEVQLESIVRERQEV